MRQEIGIVVPTLGKRPKFLNANLRSIKSAGDAFVCLVAPANFDSNYLLESGLIDLYVVDPGRGLPEAINAGFRALPKNIQFINWLGDDDLLAPNALQVAHKAIRSEVNATFVFGGCSYINVKGEEIWRNNSGPWAVKLLRFGPDLIPQPGALIRRKSFEQAGGLSSTFDWAFDFDLFIKLSKIGKGIHLREVLSSFRWHSESLSVEFRRNSVEEASRVRRSHLPLSLKKLSLLWEFPVQLATLFAGKKLARKLSGLTVK